MHILASGNITIGDHHGVIHVAGLTIYMDVVWTTLIAAGIVLGLGLLMRRKVTSGVPGKLQLFWEVLVEQVTDLATSAIGPEGVPFVGLGVTIFFFILICNCLAFVPSGEPGLPGCADRGRQPAARPGPHRDLPGPLQLGQKARFPRLLPALQGGLTRA